ncbi:MAG: helix-turn-helix transcriptional regulator [Thermoflexales bacterium]|nr:helix-turn-helix transcriptional regulator [Thermoflexales bacterium]
MAVRKRRSRHEGYNAEPLQKRLTQLMEQHNENYRATALRSGLDHQSVRRILVMGKRPNRETLIALADHFGINPNELLELGQYKPLRFFQIETASAEALPTEAVDVALDIAKIPDPGTRKAVAQAVRTLLKKYFEE